MYNSIPWLKIPVPVKLLQRLKHLKPTVLSSALEKSTINLIYLLNYEKCYEDISEAKLKENKCSNRKHQNQQ